MSGKKSTLVNAGGFAAAFVGAVATEHFSHAPVAGPVMLVLSHLLTHAGSEFIHPLGEEIIEQFKGKRPDELNHDIQRELVESMKKSIEGIEVLYKDQYGANSISKKTKAFLKEFKHEFFEQYLPGHGYTLPENEVKKIIYQSSTKKDNQYLFNNNQEPDAISQVLKDVLQAALEERHIEQPFIDFFVARFIPLTQFYFGEKLKHDKNGAARIALERMLAEETLSGVNKLIALQEKRDEEIQQHKTLGKLGRLNTHKTNQLKSLAKELNEPTKINVAFSEALDQRLNELTDHYKGIHDTIAALNRHVLSIRKTLRKQLLIAFAAVALAAIIVTILVMQKNSAAFTASFSFVQKDGIAVNKNYPPLTYPVSLLLKFPEKTETVVLTEGNSTALPDIDHHLKNKATGLQLLNDYWKISDKEFTLHAGKNIINIEPNEKLAKVEGTVYTINRNAEIVFIKDALIHFGNDTVLHSDTNGSFRAFLPVRMRKEFHEVTTNAKGYEVKIIKEYYPGSSVLKLNLTSIQ